MVVVMISVLVVVAFVVADFGKPYGGCTGAAVVLDKLVCLLTHLIWQTPAHGGEFCSFCFKSRQMVAGGTFFRLGHDLVATSAVRLKPRNGLVHLGLFFHFEPVPKGWQCFHVVGVRACKFTCAREMNSFFAGGPCSQPMEDSVLWVARRALCVVSCVLCAVGHVCFGWGSVFCFHESPFGVSRLC